MKDSCRNVIHSASKNHISQIAQVMQGLWMPLGCPQIMVSEILDDTGRDDPGIDVDIVERAMTKIRIHKNDQMTIGQRTDEKQKI